MFFGGTDLKEQITCLTILATSLYVRKNKYWVDDTQVDDYAIKTEIETDQCSFLRFRPSGDRVLPLSMRYPSLALRWEWVVIPAK